MSPIKLNPQQMRELRELADLGTEEAHADIWTRFGLTPGQAETLAWQAKVRNRGPSDASGGPRPFFPIKTNANKSR